MEEKDESVLESDDESTFEDKQGKKVNNVGINSSSYRNDTSSSEGF